MEAIAPDPPRAPEHTVDRLCDPYREPAHAALELRGVGGFHQQVQMIGLDAELEHAEPGLRRLAEGSPDRDEGGLAAQRRQLRDCAKGDVRRTARDVRRSSAMRNRPSTGLRWAAGPASPATPGAERQLELLHAAHLNRAIS
jgi:hypothetical protein